MSVRKGSPLPRPSADALSLNSQHGSGSGVSRTPLVDVDDDPSEQLLIADLPPLYSEINAVSGPAPIDEAAAPGAGEPLGDVSGDAPDDRLLFIGGDGHTGIIDAVRDVMLKDEAQPVRKVVIPGSTGWKSLADQVFTLACRVPRPYVRLLGSHMQTIDRDGKKENRKVTDFDVRLDLTPYLYSDVQRNRAWRSVHLISNHTLARRGTVFRCRDSAAGPERAQEEVFVSDECIGLEGWCQRFCADRSALKCFTLERRVTGFDQKKVRTQMETLVRRTNYRGHLKVSFPVDEARIHMYNDHPFNRWRLTRWIRIVCIATLFIVFTWPFLFFRTKRYEVVVSCWAFSRQEDDRPAEYVSLSEDQLYNLWARAISKAVLEKRQTVLDQEDLRAAEGAEPTFRSGSEAVDGAVGFVQAGISAMNHINRQNGWGADC
ncbi:hypothetical protein CMQ_4213 [Grosmannia clavigera kw1407]|uniref:Uncharacterized protein n=1 Tax=Grosmannia clavigera (strain kw1407 / UAMH 11150) TaxID=655863 RepID=F0XAA8_GROCL|nr:uncharacterized protein CMQ_4213 [Grosmannia clavigera kw1407]EFX06144.1 hypothetical protein CMQ_4213 [Grosmannia clavigera kw1407]